MSYLTTSEVNKAIRSYSSATVAKDKVELRLGKAIHEGRKMKGGIRAFCVLIHLNLSEAQRLLLKYRKSEGLI